jgi:hypothetical protein
MPLTSFSSLAFAGHRMTNDQLPQSIPLPRISQVDLCDIHLRPIVTTDPGLASHL